MTGNYGFCAEHRDQRRSTEKQKKKKKARRALGTEADDKDKEPASAEPDAFSEGGGVSHRQLAAPAAAHVATVTMARTPALARQCAGGSH